MTMKPFSLFGCNVAPAFSRACRFDLIFFHIWASNWCPKIPSFVPRIKKSCNLQVHVLLIQPNEGIKHFFSARYNNKRNWTCARAYG